LLPRLKKEPSQPRIEDLRLNPETPLAEVFRRHGESRAPLAKTVETPPPAPGDLAELGGEVGSVAAWLAWCGDFVVTE